MGGKRTYDLGQRTKLALLRQVHEDSVTARTEMRARIEEEYRERMEQFDYRKSRLMNELRGMGVAKTDIGLAVRLAHWPSLEALYALTAPEFEGARESVGEFTLLPGVLAKDQPHEFVLNWATIEGVEYTVPTTWGIAWEDGMWDLLMPDSDHETEMSAAYMRASFESGNGWRLDTARRVAEAYMKRDGSP